ncbi:MAG: iron chelate uptake ABC transporter family permease subunit, partial [Alphaproteobacteria bacterium]
MDEFLWRALAAGLGVALVTGPLGSFVVWGRMAFFGEAIAHSALFGVALGLLLGISQIPAVAFVAAAVAVLLVTLQSDGRLPTDTLLGILAHGFLGAGLVAISFLPTVRVDLLGYLFGDILAVTRSDVALIWITACLGVAAIVLIWRPLLSVTVHADLARVEGVPITQVRLAFLLI